VQWPEGFRPDPNARWDDEIKRLSEAADAFERFAKVVQSTLLERRSRWSNCLEFSSPGTSDCLTRLRRLLSAAWSVQLSLPPARLTGRLAWSAR
jgi:hypothetical protein